MKLAMNMIRQYADIPVTPEEYTQRMIMTGTAVEGTEDISGGMEKVVVGRVLTCTDVEGTHLHECTVDVGGPETLHIVCGAPNVAAGQLVPVARSWSQMTRSSVRRARSFPSSVVSVSPGWARRTTICRPRTLLRSKACMGWPYSIMM